MLEYRNRGGGGGAKLGSGHVIHRLRPFPSARGPTTAPSAHVRCSRKPILYFTDRLTVSYDVMDGRNSQRVDCGRQKERDDGVVIAGPLSPVTLQKYLHDAQVDYSKLVATGICYTYISKYFGEDETWIYTTRYDYLLRLLRYVTIVFLVTQLGSPFSRKETQ